MHKMGFVKRTIVVTVTTAWDSNVKHQPAYACKMDYRLVSSVQAS